MLKPVWISFRLLDRADKLILIFLTLFRLSLSGLDLIALATVALLARIVVIGEIPTDVLLFEQLDGDALPFALVGLIGGTYLIRSLSAAALSRTTAKFLARVETTFASRAAEFVFSDDLSRLKSYSRGDLHWTVSQSAHTAFSGLLFSGTTVIVESGMFLAVLGVFLFFDALLAIGVAIYLLLIATFFQLFLNRRLKHLGVTLSETSVGITDLLFDMVNIFKEASALSRRNFFLIRFSELRHRQATVSAVLRFWMAMPRIIMELALVGAIIAAFAWLVTQDDIREGLVIISVFLAGALRVLAGIVPLQTAISEIRAISPLATRAHEMFLGLQDQSEKSSEIQGAQIIKESLARKRVDPMPIELCDVTFSYPDEKRPVLRDISLSIRAGGHVALLGPSGGGKTSLADIITGVLRPTSGTAIVGGLPPEVTRDKFPGSIAYVPQIPSLVGGSVADNVALGVQADEVDREWLLQILFELELETFIQSLPRGIDSALGNQSDGLSGGQRQRLGLARAIYFRPSVLVLDEATSALDAETESAVSRMLEKLRPQTTQVVIAHRIASVQSAEEVFFLKDGLLEGGGTLAQLRREVPEVDRYIKLMSLEKYE